jgi:hypothetical protein
VLVEGCRLAAIRSIHALAHPSPFAIRPAWRSQLPHVMRCLTVRLPPFHLARCMLYISLGFFLGLGVLILHYREG